MTNVEDSSNEIMKLILKIIHAIDLQSQQSNLPVDISGPQLVMLHKIQYRAQRSSKQLAEYKNMNQSRTSSILDPLIAKNLIIRTKDETSDEQKWILKITPTGQAALDNSPLAMVQQFISKFTNLSESEQSEMFTTIQKIAEMFHEQSLIDGVSEIKVS